MVTNKFSFIDSADAQRILQVDRVTFEQLLTSGQLKPLKGTGKDVFFRLSDVQELHDILHKEASGETEESETGPKVKNKQHDPAMRVHLRLQADLKWFDITINDIDLWLREVRSDSYDKYLTNISHVEEKLDYIKKIVQESKEKLKDV